MAAALREETLRFYVGLATDILIEVAQGKRDETKLIYYSELMDEMGGPGRGYIAEVLEEICCSEHAKHHPLLTALVVHKVDRQPGYGFWCIRVLPESVKKPRILRRRPSGDKNVIEYGTTGKHIAHSDLPPKRTTLLTGRRKGHWGSVWFGWWERTIKLTGEHGT